jgi:hypothetical protein
MSSDGSDGVRVLNAAIREAFGRIVYSHKTHEKAREIESHRVTLVKWTNIVLTTLTSASLLGTIITNAHALLYLSSGLSALVLAFVIFQFSFDPAGAADKHRIAANELWYLREQYCNLLTDIRCGAAEDEIVSRRDKLTDQLKAVYAHAPDTSSRAYRKAQEALKVKEDMTFSAAEINQFLPKELHEDE